jgi:hypothetical protein
MLSTDWNITTLINPKTKEVKDIDMDFQKNQSNDNISAGYEPIK